MEPSNALLAQLKDKQMLPVWLIRPMGVDIRRLFTKRNPAIYAQAH